MFEHKRRADEPKAQRYAALASELTALLGGERDFVANAANFCALLYHSIEAVNWVGFYVQKAGVLVLGPFQGQLACTRIAMGRGVCGTSASRRETVVVPDVRGFPGYIACDPVTRSEIVVPLVQGGRLIGVLDLDSPVLARFDAEDRAGLERLAAIFLEKTAAPDD